MPGRKFRLSVYRKNEERRKWPEKPKEVVSTQLLVESSDPMPEPDDLIVSLPLSAYTSSPVESVQTLNSRMQHIDLPHSWFVASTTGRSLVLYKVRPQPTPTIAVDVFLTITVDELFNWSLSVFGNNQIQLDAFPSLPVMVTTVDTLLQLVAFLDTCKICHGNSEKNLIEVWSYQSKTTHGAAGIIDSSSLSTPTIRHSNCQLLLPPTSQVSRCVSCTAHRTTLRRVTNKVSDSPISMASHTNYRYLSNSDLVSRLKHVQHDRVVKSKQLERLKLKLSQSIERDGVNVDHEMHSFLKETKTGSTLNFPENSFQALFWKQQMEAARKQDSRGMRWHPLMIRWCLYLRYKLSGAYEMLRESGCVKLPSQCTLRDYTHHIPATIGFSSEVDEMLMKAAFGGL